MTPGQGVSLCTPYHAPGAQVDALSEAMYDMAHTGAQRVALLCRSPAGLACWALELLEEQATSVRNPCCLIRLGSVAGTHRRSVSLLPMLELETGLSIFIVATSAPASRLYALFVHTCGQT